MTQRENLLALATAKGSLGVFVVVVLVRMLPGRFQSLEFSPLALFHGAVLGALAVALIQVWVRLTAPMRDMVALGLASAALLWAMVGTEVFSGRGAGIEWFIVLAIWGGISLAALVLIVVYRRT